MLRFLGIRLDHVRASQKWVGSNTRGKFQLKKFQPSDSKRYAIERNALHITHDTLHFTFYILHFTLDTLHLLVHIHPYKRLQILVLNWRHWVGTVLEAWNK
jgi:hypothetical protein